MHIALRKGGKRIASGFILAFILAMLATIGGAEENTHECYLHQFLYGQNFGDVLNIYGCVTSTSFRYFNAYAVEGLGAGLNVHIVVTPVTALTGKRLADLQVQVQSVAIPPQVVAFSPIVSNAAVVLDWTPSVSGTYDLYVTTTGLQDTDYDGATLGQYDLFLTQLEPMPTPSPSLTRGRPTTPTPTPGDRGRPTAAATATPTPTPTPASKTRVVGFR